MDSVYETARRLLTPADVCQMCDDVFADEPEKLSQCRSDCASEQLGELRVSCASPWYEVFSDRSKTVCIDGNVFILPLSILYLAVVVAFMI